MPVFDAELATFQQALRGQFTIERELGRGGMGVVFLARDVKLERLAAIKVLPPDHGGRDDTRERFLREARLAAQLSHPNIVPVFRADEVDGFAYFVMAYVDGESLAERLRTRGPLPLPEAVRYLREVAWALAYAHARGVVHRDVKPENIMVERGSGRALVTDFGIARDATATSITATGNVLGTVHYMSPEQIAGDTLDGRSDLYSLGVVGYYLLSGQLPFAGPSPSAVLLAHATRPAPPLASVAPDVPSRIAAIIDRCLAKNRIDRYETGESLAEQLGKAWSAVEAEQLIATPSGQRSFSETEAMSLWRRAAQLQADAARRLEQRTRSSTDMVAPASSADPTQAFRLRDIERAAVEAGISRQFIAMAVAEARPESPTKDAPPPEKGDALLSLLVRTNERSITVSRVIRAQASKVLLSLGRVFQTAPFDLQLHETIGPHPLDGGILVFDVPKMKNDGTTAWTATRYSCFIKQIRVTLHRVPNDSNACEVTIHGDLRRGVRSRTKWGAALGGLTTVVGGALSTIVAAKSTGIAGLVGVALGAAGWAATLLVGGAIALGYASTFPRAFKRTEAEFDAALRAIERALFSNEVFGEPPPALAPASPVSSSPAVADARVT